MVMGAALGFSTSAAAAAVPTGNLLQDPGAELDGGSTDSACGANATLNGAWSGQAGFTAVRYGTGNYPDQTVSSAIGGGQNFFTGGCAADTTASQLIDVSAYTGDFAAGQIQAALSADLGGYLAQEDAADVYATFESCGDSTTLGTIAIGPVTAEERGNQTTLLPRTSLAMVPAGTCSINVVMHFARASGTSNDGYADNLSLSLTDLATNTLTVNVAGTGTGSVAGDQAPQIQCPSTCQQAYPSGTLVTLTATPSGGSTFTGWSGGACSGTAGTCAVTVGADTTVNATFAHATGPSVPLNTRLPSISGTARQYEVLTTDGGLWSGGVTGLTYQWLRCATSAGGVCNGIPGATGSSYTLTGDDVGSTIRARVTAHNGAGASAPADSAASTVVARGVTTAHLTFIPNPTCTGIPTVLDASGSVSPDGIRSYAFSFIDFFHWFDDHYTPQSEGQIAFGMALAENTLLGLEGAGPQQEMIDNYSSRATVTTGPTLTETFGWNREYWVDESDTDPATFNALVRDPVGVVLVVTDYAGNTSETTGVLTFTQGNSIESRAHCPRTSVLLKRLAGVLAAIQTLQPGAAKSATLTTTSKCKAKTACVGSILVTTVCKRCATIARARHHAVVLGHGFFNIRPHKTGHIVVSLTKQGKNALRRLSRHASLKVEVTVSSIDVLGRRRVRSYASVVRR
jgi:hypothetical protein